MKIRKITTAALLFLAPYLWAQEKEYFPDPNPVIRERLEEWQDLKFGLLMHWGAYSQWGIVESWSICPEDLSWSNAMARKKGIADDNFNDYLKAYEGLQKTFNPVKFDPEKWASAAKRAGMKYMIFTTKHHDGFCMYDTQYTDYKITDSSSPFSKNPKKDVTKEIFNAFRTQDFWIGAYFSKPDWHSDFYWWKNFPPADRNPNYSIEKYPEQWNKFKTFTHNQIKELTSNYGKVDILWLDGGWVRKTTPEETNKTLHEIYEGSRWARNPQSQDIDMPGLVSEIRKNQPKLIVVDRAVPGEQQNYLTPEQHIPDTGLPYPWETCMTMATSWSYKPNDDYKSTNELVEKLVDVVSKGGNFLLNIGPGPDGTLDEIAYQRLDEMGKWMDINGKAIYNTRMHDVFGEGEKIRFTKSKDGSKHFVFFFDKPKSKEIITKLAIDSNAKITLLGSDLTLKAKKVNNGVEISFPKKLPTQLNHVWVLQIEK